MKENKKPLIILTGPTAVGKTELSLELAERIGGEIISADSMQVYRHMDVGTAKIKKEEQRGIAHHLIDVCDPWEEYNVVRFQQSALSCMEEIYGRGHIPVVTGGTGFYIQALLYGIDFSEQDAGQQCREKLEEEAEKKGTLWMHARLREVDPVSADAIHPNNRKRVIRALEYYELTGQPFSGHNEEQRKKESCYRSAYFVLNRNRAELYERIDRRVDQMIEEGLVEEVRRLTQEWGLKRTMVSMQGLGYKEIAACLAGECSLEEAVYILKRDTRHFAKRQLTWFKREREVIWLNREEYGSQEAVLQHMLAILEEKEIIRAI